MLHRETLVHCLIDHLVHDVTGATRSGFSEEFLLHQSIPIKLNRTQHPICSGTYVSASQPTVWTYLQWRLNGNRWLIGTIFSTGSAKVELGS